MARFFIDHPVFAMVIAIVIVILGIVALPNLPIAAYPEVVPPVVQITATYLGGNSQDLEKTVAQPIEEQLVGLDGLLYFLSSSANDGTLTIQVTFKLGTNPDIAAVQTQNRVSVAMPRLPPEVQRTGVTVKKVSSAFLVAISLIPTDNRYDSLFLNNYVQINLLNQIGSLEGVGESRLNTNLIYSMRVWVNPDKMAKLGITATDVSNAIQAQNRQNPAGAFGQPPSPKGTDFQYAVNAPGRLVDPRQFEDIVLRAQPDTSLLRIRDIGHVQLGAQTYAGFSRVDGRPAGNMVVFLSPGANAIQTVDRVKKFLDNAKKSFPAGLDYIVSYDSTMFVRAAIKDVLKTLFIAVGLVILVVFIFLQNWRATLIPLLTVPVAIIGTLALFPILGFSINLTSMFGLVLAIGIVVDDAIVVVEAVQRHIDDGMAPHEATVRAMEEVSAPVVAIACILAAVFIPVAFLGGISGQIYKQFALTIAASVLISAFNALSLSPALSAIILRPHSKTTGLLGRFFGLFNAAFTWATDRYLSGVGVLIRKSALALAGLLCFWIAAGYLFHVLPTGFLPDEDQGAFFVAIRLPDGASIARTEEATKKIEDIVLHMPGVTGCLTLGGTDIATRTNSSNVSTLIARLDPWDVREAKGQQLQTILASAQRAFYKIPEAFTFAFGLPPILGLSTTGGFQYMLEDRAGGDIQQLSQTADLLIQTAHQRKELGTIISTFRPNVPQYNVDVDVAKVQTLNIPISDAYNTLQTFLGGLYVNDFNVFGHTWQVLVEAEPEFRTGPDDINRFYTRTNDGTMVPLGTLATVKAKPGPDIIYRYNRFRAIQLLGSPAPGYSSGQASSAMEQVSASTMPQGYGYEWTGTTYQEKEAEGHEGVIFGFAAVLVFLFLAALYESWSIPFAVILALPLGLFGALLAVWLRSYPYDIYTQIGIVTLIGLAAKNAILIVEFARMRREQGLSIFDAAMEAARLRLRPILMTSFAFILGVVPLAIAFGAGAASRRSLGTAVFGGMNTATLLAIFIVPVLYVVVQRLVPAKKVAQAVASILLVMFLTGCRLGPNYKRPAVPIPNQYHGSTDNSAASVAETKWADLFQDDTLKQLVTTALEHNFDLGIASERVLEARAQFRITRGNEFPNLQAQAGFTALRQSSVGSFKFLAPGTDLSASYTQVGGALSWELDFWGRYRRLTESARAQYLATEQARRGVIVSVIADVMNNYFLLRERDLELQIARQTSDIAQDNLRLVQLRHTRGAATGLDEHQAEQFLYTATVQIASAERDIEQAEDALSLLLGQTPGEIARGKSLEQFAFPAQVPPGLPSTLLERRPDIRQAEDNLIAANAQIGAAKALYFPQVSLTGFMGGQSRELTSLFTGPARFWSLAPAAAMPIFDAGQTRAGVRFSEAQQREMLIAYQKSVYNAFKEVSDALAGYDLTGQQRAQEELLVKALDESTRLSKLRYRGGLDSYLQVLDSERNLFQGQLALAQLRLLELQSFVQLYRALGGGWQ